MTNTYKSTLDYLYKQLPMYQRIGAAAFKKDLTNIRALCTALGDPQNSFASIHIAGTNGKGSTAHLLAAILQAQGLKVGLYTSPHYKDFRERIKINGSFISPKAVIQFVTQNKMLFEDLQPSFFEITVAMAFEYFAHKKVDIAVIETGLGGRLDSTNIIQPILSIITNISFDHQQFLGNTLPLIAGEKAGIIKDHTPVVIGETHAKTKVVFEQVAKQRKAPIFFADKFFRAQLLESGVHHSTYKISNTQGILFEALKVNLHGQYQQKNIVTVFQALEVLQPYFPISKPTIEIAFSDLKVRTRFMGRWQILAEQPLTISDSAHNIAGLQTVLEQLNNTEHEQLHLVIGVVNDKDIHKLLSLLPSEAKYYFAKANIPRGLDAKILKEKAANHGLKGRAYTSVKNALRAAKRQAIAQDLIYVGGSIFVVAEVI